MTVKIIYPCVCIDHKQDGSDVCDYGMPKLYVANSIHPGKQFWIAYCPNCKRGWPGFEQKSAYLALKDWNELQKKCWDTKCKEFWSGDWKVDCPDWRKDIMREMDN